MTDRFFSCSICKGPSARAADAGCDICRKHFCGVHISHYFHHCSDRDLDDAAYERLIIEEIGRLRAQINDEAVCELASSLNDGKRCVIEYPSKAVGPDSLTGCANFHDCIRFSDGSPSWLMRVPRV
ncbi:hypothetical protein LY78DRAFT_702454 [Colletotrichum sublineola]|nr:hypothetical protein LY78DRAFT_702454 [Colletotrichum sublineola]